MSGGQFSILPKDILATCGHILFTRITGVLLTEDGYGRYTEEDGLDQQGIRSAELFWSFLRRHPSIRLVLLTDKQNTEEMLRQRTISPHLGMRFIGATDDAEKNPLSAVLDWLETFGGHRRYSILDNRVERYPRRMLELIPIFHESGVTELDLFKIVDHLKASSDLLLKDDRPIEDALCIAANLSLCGQLDQADLLLRAIAERAGVSLDVSSRHEDGSRGSSFKYILGKSKFEDYYRLSSALNVRLRVIAEPADS